MIALYIGGMGTRNRNFHKDSMIRRGFAEVAEHIQELFLAGREAEAAEAVPDEYVDESCLIGPRDRIASRFAAWRDCGLTSLAVRTTDPATLNAIATVALADARIQPALSTGTRLPTTIPDLCRSDH